MDDTDLYQRWKFRLPEDYQQFAELGLLKEGSRASGLYLSQYRWLTLKMIARYDWPDYKCQDLIPFAESPSGDTYCWWKVRGVNCVVFSAHDLNVACGFAPNFTGAVYRMLLDEMASSWQGVNHDLTPVELQHKLQGYVEQLKPVMNEKWLRTLTHALRRPPVRTDCGDEFLSLKEVATIVKRDLNFPLLDVEVPQYLNEE